MQAAVTAPPLPEEPAPPAESGRMTQLQALFRIASLLGAPGGFRDNARKMLEVMLEVVDADRAVLRMPEAASGSLVTVAAAGPLTRSHPPAAITRRGGLTRRAYRDKEVVIENDHKPGKRTGRVISGPGVRSMIALPLLAGETVTGVLDVGSAAPDFFSAERVELLTAIAGALGALIENAQLRESLEVERAIRARVDNFVSIVSHELRTPMTTLLGYSELLLRDEPPPEVRREWFGLINAESKRLTEILDDLLDITRINSGLVRVNPHPMALGPLAVEVAAAEGVGSPIHDITVASAETLPSVLADRDKVRQVLANLVDNAVKYSPAGGRVSISFKLDAARSRVTTSVSDEGIGIAPGDRGRLFEMFQRVRTAETATIRGTGVGLHVVKSLVELMGGEVWVRGRRRRGSTFSFTLPVAAQLPAESAPAPVLPPYHQIQEFMPGPHAMGALLPGAVREHPLDSHAHRTERARKDRE